MSESLNLTELKSRLVAFAKEREWEQFHTPKNLSMALAGEAAELMELFQWLTPEESFSVVKDEAQIKKIHEEIADILIYTIRLSTVLGVDIPSVIDAKIKRNAEKYPIEKAKGSAKKYTEF